jgi:2-aminoadipate transaminase
MPPPLRYAERLRDVGHSDVVEILRLSEQRDVLSLAGGLPAPESFFLEDTAAEIATLLQRQGRAMLGYGPTEGVGVLREALAQRMSDKGRATEVDEVLVTTGGIAALDLVAKALLDPGDLVLVEDPSYLAAMHVFRSYQARLEGVATDSDGVDLEALRETLGRCRERGALPKFFYLIPSFQNPTGCCLAAERRAPLLELCRAFGVPVVEDGAYEDLRFAGSPIANLAAHGADVIHVNTFSKILHPGVRLGWICGPRAFVEVAALCKQGQDQCSGTLSQYLAERFLRTGLVDRQLEGARQLYRRRWEVTRDAIEGSFPSGTATTRPEGGFYCWVTLPEGLDAAALLPRAVAEERVAYVAGPAFFHDRKRGTRNLRLAYSYVDEAALADAVTRLGRFFSARS